MTNLQLTSVITHINHRSRVALMRREKTRKKLLKAALHVFSRHGVDAKVIDLIIKKAMVSRGTFYNYFSTNEELFIAAAEEVASEIIRITDPIVLKQCDPAAAIACGVSLVIKLANTYPIFAEFIIRGGPPALGAGSLVPGVVLREVHAGIASGHFSITDARLGFDLVTGPVISAFNTLLTEGISDNYPQALAQSVLQALGVENALAHKYATIDFGDVTVLEDSIFNSSLRASTS